MVAFRFLPLNSTEPTSEALAQLEITTLFVGSSSPRSILLDQDEALRQFIRKYIDDDRRADYFAEPALAEDEMMDMFSSNLLEMARERANALGDAYPFIITPSNRLEIKKTRIHAVGVSYLSIQAMRLSQQNLIEIVAEDDKERKKILMKFCQFFARTFEFASAYVVAGDKGGMPIVLSNCRSFNDLYRKLKGICGKVRSGKVKTLDNWSALQRVANDGGVDAVVHVGADAVTGNTTLIIVGATYQQKKIDVKIMGSQARNRFADFFVTRPAPLQGALVRLADADALTIEKCRLEDCLFYGYESVWRNMGRRPVGAVDSRLLSRIDAILLRNLRLFGEFTMIGDNGEISVLNYG